MHRYRELPLGREHEHALLPDRRAAVVLHLDAADLAEEPRDADAAAHVRGCQTRAHELDRTDREETRPVRRATIAEVEPCVAEEVADARNHASHGSGGPRERPRARDLRLLIDDHVARRDAVGYGLVRVEAALRHTQRDEQQLARRGLVGLCRSELDEPAEDREARVRVVPDLTERRELFELRHRGDVFGERIVALARVGEAVAEPTAGVGHEMSERCARRRVLVAHTEFGNVATDRGVEIERATLHETHHDRGRDRLRDRGDLEERVGIDRKRMLDVRHAVCRDVFVALVQDPDRDTGDVVLGHPFPHQLIELRSHARILDRTRRREAGASSASLPRRRSSHSGRRPAAPGTAPDPRRSRSRLRRRPSARRPSPAGAGRRRVARSAA